MRPATGRPGPLQQITIPAPRPRPSPGVTAPALGKDSADCLRFHLYIALAGPGGTAGLRDSRGPCRDRWAIQAPALTAGAPPHLHTRLQAPSKKARK